LLDIQECRVPDPFDWVIGSKSSQELSEYLEK